MHTGNAISRNSIDLHAPAERAILVGAPIKSARARHLLNEHLEELAELADTAGATVVGEVTQMLDRPHPGTYLGKGKIEELRLAIEDKQATIIIFDDELSPAQGRNVETALNTRVVDRAELILDIFATRARTSEAKMQVELAQLEYTLPRLTRMWTHLEKFRGGIGMRGPGETQLETDRRLINNRIKLLKERLVDVTRARVVQRHSRRGEFRVSLVGYTNAGKSSVLRALAGDSQVFVEDRLFATLDPLTREVKLGEHQKALVTDTVGFIRKLPHHLVASFRATLEEVNESDLLLHVIDASRSTWEDHVHVVDGVLNELGVLDKPVLHVFNKIDRIDNDALLSLQERVRDQYPDSIFVSAVAEDGLEPLLRSLTTRVRTMRPVSEVRISVGDGRLLAELHREGEVIDQRSEDAELVLHVRATEALIGRLKRGGATVS
ncbi:MAG: GTPase HflX [Gemmatimonadaceae bacterium]